jgi:hypothetical protein
VVAVSVDSAGLSGAASVVAAILGDDVEALPPAVRAMHAAASDTSCSGVLEVQQAESRTGHLVVRLLRMPATEGPTSVSLTIERSDGVGGPVERWRRSFAGHGMSSELVVDGDRLVERVGAVHLRFTLAVAGGRLSFRHEDTAVRIGRRRLQLPRFFSPTVEASVGAGSTLGTVHVAVRIAVPILGPLLAYEGNLVVTVIP